jgi:hypothetical protein
MDHRRRDAMPNEIEPAAKPSRRALLSWKALILIVVLAIIGAALWMFHQIQTWPQRTSRDVLAAFREVAQIQPQIRIRNEVLYEQTKDALELAVVTRETQVEREMQHDWLGSKKRIRIRARYVVKAGFDLRERCTVEIEGSRIRVELPPPRVLSVDPRDTEVLVFENGLWNRIKPTELENELKALPELARRKAEETGLAEEALSTFTRRLREQLAPGYQVEFIGEKTVLD